MKMINKGRTCREGKKFYMVMGNKKRKEKNNERKCL